MSIWIGSGFGARPTSNGSSMTTRCSTTNLDVTPDWVDSRRLRGAVHLDLRPRASTHIAGDSTAMACFRPRLPPKLVFATDRLWRWCEVIERLENPVIGHTGTCCFSATRIRRTTTPPSGAVEHMTICAHQRSAKAHQRRGLHDHGHAAPASGRHQ